MRRVIAALVVVGLAVGVVLLWPRATTEETPTTLAGPTTTASTSTTTPSTSTTTTVPDSTTTTITDSHVVETVEEAETILRELWFGWFEGIYNEDEDRIREVVGNPEEVESAVNQFGAMDFTTEPTADGLHFGETEILRSDNQCLAIWSEVSANFREGSLAGVHVFRWLSDRWLLVNTWPLRDDLWETDCDVVF